jgi:hypothetical protein
VVGLCPAGQTVDDLVADGEAGDGRVEFGDRSGEVGDARAEFGDRPVKSETPAPSSAIGSAKSLPWPSANTAGQTSAKRPCRMPVCSGLTPATTTRTDTSARPGCGGGNWTASSTSGPP